MSVLIITEPYDIHGHALIWALAQLGVDCYRWSTSEFPEQQLASVRISAAFDDALFNISGIPSHEPFTSIWVRRPALPRAISSSLASTDVAMALGEAKSFMEGMRPIFSTQSVWVNPLQKRQAANMKPYQLQTAKKMGFVIPETLLSNDPIEIRAFYREHNGNVVYKPFTPAYWHNQTNGRASGLFTTLLTDNIFQQHDASFTSCPGIYQRCIPKKSDLRVTFFGGSYFSARIHSQQLPISAIDFRADMKGKCLLEEFSMSQSLLEKCKALAAELGVLHGSFDFVEQPDGSIVFLEVNEMGQFLLVRGAGSHDASFICVRRIFDAAGS